MLGLGLNLWRPTLSGGAALSLAAELANGEADALALSFLDDYFLSSTSFYGSAYIVDTGTPANDYDNSLDTSAASLLTYTSPSPKQGMQADGEYKYFAHNRVTHSEDFADAAWTKGLVTVPTSAVEVYGGITYDFIRPTTSGADSHFIRQDATSVGPARIEVRAKADGYSKVALYADGPAEAATFDLSAGTAGNTSWANNAADFDIEDLGDGHYLCWIETTTSITRARVYILNDPDAPVYAGDGTSGVTLGGFAVRYAPAVNTYLKTVASARYALPIEFDGAGSPLGLRPEGARTNLFLNSETGATQDCTVAAEAYTLSFWGTGTITLSGVSSSGPLVGTGAANRVTLTFTPTAGTLTLTVSGTCTRVQLEAGSAASSYIRTAGSTVTRAADVFGPPLTAFPWNGGTGAYEVDGVSETPTDNGTLLTLAARSGETHIQSVLWVPA